MTEEDFYPRSPCGERPLTDDVSTGGRIISIHALLAESDIDERCEFSWNNGISIHALLAESDPPVRDIIQWEGIFLSTLSLRRATSLGAVTSPFVINFYPRSPCGERQGSLNLWDAHRVFLSTLSLRRATLAGLWVLSTRIFLSTLSLRRATY